MAGGRPTKYKPEYCQTVIDLMREGASVEEVAYDLEVDDDTIREWAKVHPEFSAALTKAKAYSKGWWHKHGRINIYNKEFNTGMYVINMKNRHGWSDKREIKEESHTTVTFKETSEIEAIKKSFEKPI